MATDPQAIRIWEGNSIQQGATCDGLGVDFSLFSANATKVELCLFDQTDPNLVSLADPFVSFVGPSGRVANPGDFAGGGNVDFDLLCHGEEEQARILHSPFDVRHREVTRGGQSISDQPALNLGSDLMPRTVNCQDSVQLCSKLTVYLKLADRMARRENNFRVLLSLEHARFHPIVARRNPTVAAPRIDHDRTAGFPGGEIGADCSVREFEFPMRGVERARQQKLDQGFRGIQLKGSRPRFNRRGLMREG
jgi:hypothetical protein